MRTVFVSIMMLSLGCAGETTGLRLTLGDAGGEAAQVSLSDAAAIDTEATIDVGAIDQGEAAFAPVDAGRIDATPINCIQRVIDNGYSSCAPGDPYRTACDTCTSDRDVVAASACRAQIDCLLKHPICDVDCYTRCVSVGGEIANVCVYKIVTASCGEQLWHPGASWGCQKAP